jgi:hypothetical protein
MNLHLRRAATVAGVVWLRGELLLRASVAAARWLFRIITHSFPSLSCCWLLLGAGNVEYDRAKI